MWDHFKGGMSLDKAVVHGKENRKPYRGPAAFDPACQRHGNMGCPMCRGNRTIIDRRLRSRAKDDKEDEQE